MIDFFRLEKNHKKGWCYEENKLDVVFEKICNNKNTLDLFVNNILKIVNAFSFAGVDLDWKFSIERYINHYKNCIRLINITGMIGYGKTTMADKYRNDKNYVVVSLDCLYRGQDKENMNEETVKINKILKEKFLDQDNNKYFREYYVEIINYISNFDKSVIWVLEDI